ncbi:hypothetical protein M8C21_028828, partial [Ambrosia artemisiifolia]
EANDRCARTTPTVCRFRRLRRFHGVDGRGSGQVVFVPLTSDIVRKTSEGVEIGQLLLSLTTGQAGSYGRRSITSLKLRHLYAKVLVVSKVPLPNYRFDLDDKRPQREVSLPPELQMRVEAHLGEYLSHKAKNNNGSQDSLFSKTTNNGSICNDEGLFEQPELGPQIQLAMEKVLRIRSVQLQTDQQAWQVQDLFFTLMYLKFF